MPKKYSQDKLEIDHRLSALPEDVNQFALDIFTAWRRPELVAAVRSLQAGKKRGKLSVIGKHKVHGPMLLCELNFNFGIAMNGGILKYPDRKIDPNLFEGMEAFYFEPIHNPDVQGKPKYKKTTQT